MVYRTGCDPRRRRPRTCSSTSSRSPTERTSATWCSSTPQPASWSTATRCRRRPRAEHLRAAVRRRRNVTEVWKEGDPFPGTLNEDQQNIVTATGEAYWFFQNAFGRDSYDGAGARDEHGQQRPAIACPNANWNGVTTNYCNGVTSDDVVAHEWGHAYTEYTHDLIYQWQPGALNESYSDIWGETVDLINGRMDDDEGDITTKRADGRVLDAHPRHDRS